MNRRICARLWGKNPRLEAKLKGAKTYLFGDFGVFMGCDG
jgi:hypothetical protein